MPGRTFQAANTSAYRFGFNDKENDRGGSWSSTQLVQDYGMRLYNPAIGKFLSVDPIAKEYSWNSPYAFAENNVIQSIDIEGLEKYEVTGNTITYKATKVIFTGRPASVGGNATNAANIIALNNKHWADINKQMSTQLYNLDISYDKNNKIAAVTLGGNDKYTIQFDVQVVSFTDENDVNFLNLIKSDEFAGIEVFGASTSFSGNARVGSAPSTFSANTPAYTERLLSSVYGKGKDITYFQSEAEYNDGVTVTHEDGHKFGLDHNRGNFSSANNDTGVLFDKYDVMWCMPCLTTPGQQPYDNTGLMRYGRSNGDSVLKNTQVENMLNATKGEKK